MSFTARIAAILLLAGASFAAEAPEPLEASGVKGGLVVHIGCGDAKMTAALRANQSYLVHGLDANAANVADAREHVRSLGLYGPVSADTFDGARLPYRDNLVNLIVASAPGGVSKEEMMRVLAPLGVAMVNEDGAWKKTVKPRPENIDDWTHFLHGPGNNAVAKDRVAGPPRGMQWVAGPRYARHHDKMSSFSAAVTSGGRVFYIMDMAPPVSILTAPQWRLVARDAFSGAFLWQREIGRWYNHMHGLKNGPAVLPRKLVAKGNRVYVTLNINGVLTALDAATGKTVQTYEGARGCEEIVLSDGVIFTCINENAPPAGPRANYDDNPRKLLAIEASTGKVLWEAKSPILAGTLAAGPQRVVFVAIDKVVCLDRKDGKEKWKSEAVPRAKKYPVRFTPTLILHKDTVLFAGGEIAAEGNRSWKVKQEDTMTALDAATGKRLWTAPHPLSGYASSEDLFVVNDVVWAGETTSGHAVGTFTGRDVRTGKVVSKFDPDVKTYWFHHRCHRGKATENYLITSRTGLEFIDVKNKSWSFNHWVRGACLYGAMPANGLVYAPQHPCACFLEAKMYGFNALSANSAPIKIAENRLVKGPAYDDKAGKAAGAGDWPTYRHDPARSGRASTKLGAKLGEGWATDVGSNLSSPVVAHDKVLVADIDTHAVHALDAKSGRILWSFIAGGRVDSPPTYHKGRVIFGSADGCVYALRASDGALAWRFRAAPSDTRIVSFEQVESVWPVHGSVLVHDGVVMFVAGRSLFLDGGIRFFRLDPGTGKVLSEAVYDEKDKAGGKMVQDYARQHNMPVALPDILSCDGRYVYMRSQPFRPSGERLPLKALPYAGNPERYSVPPTQEPEYFHLFSPTGFVDGTWWHRTYWVYGSRFLGGWAGYSQAGKVTPGGRILVFDKDNVYGYGRKPRYYRWTTPLEHQLFCASKKRGAPKPEPAPAKKAKGKRRRKRAGSKVNRLWTKDVALFARAMVLADGILFFAGPEDMVDEQQSFRKPADPAVSKKIAAQAEAFTGKRGGLLWAVSAKDGEKKLEMKLPTIPVFDGMVAANGSLYICGMNGQVMCFPGK